MNLSDHISFLAGKETGTGHAATKVPRVAVLAANELPVGTDALLR